MKMIEIGRMVMKIAGRDAGKRAVIIDILDNNLVLIDGETRRRKCNILHLEPLKETIKIKKNASHEDVKTELKKLGLEIRETKPKQKTERPRKERKTPEQLRTQKEEKKKEKTALKGKKEEKPTGKKEESLEDKAGLSEKETKNKAEKKEVKKSK
ncbi:50S ribosomal protein L14e [Candidatus Woesearchaeota archaeon]|nr:50S ribosomal protein L14e [Candidatus Woesearchaeota archaeon]